MVVAAEFYSHWTTREQRIRVGMPGAPHIAYFAMCGFRRQRNALRYGDGAHSTHTFATLRMSGRYVRDALTGLEAIAQNIGFFVKGARGTRNCRIRPRSDSEILMNRKPTPQPGVL